MAGLDKIQFFVFVTCTLLVIFPAQVSPKPSESSKPLQVTLMTHSKKDFTHTAELIWDGLYLIKQYNYGNIPGNYTAKLNTTKVIVYLMNSRDSQDIMAGKNKAKRTEIYEKLGKNKYELLYLEVRNYAQGAEKPIGEFIFETIDPHRGQPNFTIETIGRNRLELVYVSKTKTFKMYEEEDAVFDKDLRGFLNSFSVNYVGKGSDRSPVQKRKREN